MAIGTATTDGKSASRIAAAWAVVAGLLLLGFLGSVDGEVNKPISDTALEKDVRQNLESWFADHPTARVYIQVDKPLYQPGETIWFRTTLFDTASLAPLEAAVGYSCELVDPRGSTVVQKQVRMTEGVGECQVQIPEGVAGGEYKLKVSCISGPSAERPVVVNAYEPPMIKKKLTVLGKAYGPGDRVEAKAEFHRGTGEPLAQHPITGIVRVDGREFKRLDLTTDDQGELAVAVDLPGEIETENALLTLKVSEGGLTESISRGIPILLAKLNLDLFPEGGDLVAGLPSRVYFQALKPSGKPAEIEGVVLDGDGAEIATLKSYHHGMGRFEITPEAGQSYEVHVRRPVGIERTYRLPDAQPDGVVLRAADDFTGQRSDCRVTLHSTTARPNVTVVASLRERIAALRTVDLEPGANELALYPDAGQGVMRITVLDAEFAPLCERLVYRRQGHDLRVDIQADKDHYMPREKVTLTIRTKRPNGDPVPAQLGLAVVDDRVLTYADDKTAHILAELYLAKDLPGDIEEPNFYFDPDEEKAPLALELLMGTRGWRRFDWKRVKEVEKHRDVRIADQVIVETIEQYYGRYGDDDEAGAGAEGGEEDREDRRGRLERLARGIAKLGDNLLPRSRSGEAQATVPPEEVDAAADPPRLALDMKKDAPPVPDDRPAAVPKQGEAAKPADPQAVKDADELVMKEEPAEAGPPAIDEEVADIGWDERERKLRRRRWAVVREFPAVRYETTKTDVRTDFRETIFWNPRVATDADGRATVEFWLNDAVTSFKVLAEGSGTQGTPGRGELVIDSRTPMHMEAKMPVALSAGDVVELPVRVSNETDNPLRIKGGIDLPKGLRAMFKQTRLANFSLGGKDAETFYLSMQAKPGRSSGDLGFWAEAEGLTDRVARTIRVEPVGFPVEQSVSSTVRDTKSAQVAIPEGVVEGSMQARVTFYPSPMASILEGLESILREPHGCFEQTSSSTYPNIMVLNYLQATDTAEPAVKKRALDLIKKGYRRLVGYECKKNGYEWFGGDPGHEALTAYGIMEFIDMAKVYDGVEQEMIQRTVRWILARRDGKGGFERNSRALDSFGRASQEVTNAYIVWALSEARIREIDKEVKATVKTAYKSKNPYLISLALLALTNHDPDGGDAQELLGMLKGAKSEDASFPGDGRSITGSSGRQIAIESTSLAILAMLRAGEPAAALNDSVQWLLAQRSGGGFGCTQSTILALKALVEYAEASRTTQADGDLIVRVNGNVVERRHFSKGEQGAIECADFAKLLKPGDNDVDIQLMSEKELPFSLDITYKTLTPASAEDCPLKLTTQLAAAEAPMGETVALDIELQNQTEEGQPMTLVRVGIPAGLTAQMWQLKELRENGVIDFYETTPREVILYYRSLAPEAVKRVRLDLRADIPGRYTGVASCAYPYYTPAARRWNQPLKITVAR
mgnify:CR=1 FL=1